MSESDPHLQSAKRALDAIDVAIKAMKAARIEPHEAMVGMTMLCARIGRGHGFKLEQMREQLDRAWAVAGDPWE